MKILSTETSATVPGKGDGVNGPEIDMARKRYQIGSLILLPSKRWVLRWRDDVPQEDGSIKRVMRNTTLGTHNDLPTRKLASRAAEEVLGRVNARDYRPGKVIELRDLAKLWENDVLPLHEGSSQIAAKSHIKVHLIPFMGDYKLENIRQQIVQRFIVSLSAKKYNRKTVLNILGTLGSMMNAAKGWGYTVGGFDRTTLVLPRVTEEKEARHFTAEEVIMILDAVEGRSLAMLSLAAMTGLRCGDILGLKWADVDFDRKLFHVRRSCWQGILKAVKTTKARFIPMPEPLAEILLQYRDQWKQNEHDLLFVSVKGKPQRGNEELRTVVHPLLKQLGLPAGGFHAFRHEMATLLVSAGANPKVTQTQMGHSDIRTTLKRYTHLVDNDHRIAVEKVAAILSPVVRGTGGKRLTIQ